jgi:hypothetical protein
MWLKKWKVSLKKYEKLKKNKENKTKRLIVRRRRKNGEQV